MVTNDEGMKQVEGFIVYDCIILTQIIEKLLQAGAVTGKEIGHIASLRIKAVEMAEKAIGYNFETGRTEE